MGNRRFKVDHHYDKEADVLYITFGSDEPAYTENVDDFLMLDIGWFSGLPQGFRIIGPKSHDLQGIKFKAIIKKAEKRFHTVMENRRKEIKEQEPIFNKILQKEMPNILAMAQ